MPKFFKKFLLSFLAATTLLLSIVPNFNSVVATDNSPTWYNVSPSEFYQKVYDDKNPSEIFGERYTAAQVQWVFWSLGGLLISVGTGGNPEMVTCGTDITCWTNTIPKIVELVKTIRNIGKPTSMGKANQPLTLIDTMSRSPVSGVAYTKNLISKFSLVSTVHAQGFGYNTGANAVLKLWQASRNISFAFVTLIAVILAFMIMFRVKINPQTVISVQSAIPKLFIAIILITFSYAIAGFAIDLMYLVIGILASFIHGAGLTELKTADLFNSFTTGENAFSLLFEFWLAFMLTSLFSIVSAWSVYSFFGGILLFLFSVISIIVLLWFTIKILVLIFKNFASIVLTIVTGPLEILLGTVIPTMGFGQWFKKLLGHLAVYPLMALMFFLAFFFLAQSMNQGLAGLIASTGDPFVDIFPFDPLRTAISGNTWQPPLSTGFVASADALLWAIVGYVIITMIPKTIEIVQGFMTGRPFNYGSAVGEATGVLTGMGRAGTAAGVARVEEGRRVAMGAAYEPHAITQALRALGIVK